MKTFNITIESQYGTAQLYRDAVDLETCIINALNEEIRTLGRIDTITIKIG